MWCLNVATQNGGRSHTAKTWQHEQKKTDFCFSVYISAIVLASMLTRNKMSQTSSSRLCLFDHFISPWGNNISEGVPLFTETNQNPKHSYDAIFLLLPLLTVFPTPHLLVYTHLSGHILMQYKSAQLHWKRRKNKGIHIYSICVLRSFSKSPSLKRGVN